jgi:hypothetical protein
VIVPPTRAVSSPDLVTVRSANAGPCARASTTRVKGKRKPARKKKASELKRHRRECHDRLREYVDVTLKFSLRLSFYEKTLKWSHVKGEFKTGRILDWANSVSRRGTLRSLKHGEAFCSLRRVGEEGRRIGTAIRRLPLTFRVSPYRRPMRQLHD